MPPSAARLRVLRADTTSRLDIRATEFINSDNSVSVSCTSAVSAIGAGPVGGEILLRVCSTPFDDVGDGVFADAKVAGDPTIALPAVDGMEHLRGDPV